MAIFRFTSNKASSKRGPRPAAWSLACYSSFQPRSGHRKQCGPRIAKVIRAMVRLSDAPREQIRFSLREIADRAASEADRQPIRLALQATHGNKTRQRDSFVWTTDPARQDQAVRYPCKRVQGVLSVPALAATPWTSCHSPPFHTRLSPELLTLHQFDRLSVSAFSQAASSPEGQLLTTLIQSTAAGTRQEEPVGLGS